MSVKDRLLSFFKRKKNKSNKKKQVRLPSEERRELSIESSGALRSFGNSEKKESRVKFDSGYFFRAFTQVFAALFAVTAAVYFGYHLVKTFSSEITASEIYSLTETEYRSGTAYIIRDEIPVYASGGGMADYSVSEGERVAKGQTICNIYADSTGNVRKRVQVLDGEISGLKRSLGAGTVVSGVLDVSDGVENDYAEVMALIAEGNYIKAAALSDELCMDLGRLTYLSGNGAGMISRLQKLQNERAAALATLG